MSWMIPYFKNAPTDVTFFGGDPAALREVKAVELGVLGDRGLADRLNDALRNRETSVLGLPVEKKVLQFWQS